VASYAARLVSGAIYQSDPDSAPDSDFVAGSLEHLVAGNRGRLLDARRTPIRITRVTAGRGVFEVEIGAFEDSGARWELPLEDVARLQFARDARSVSPRVREELQQAVSRFDVAYAIDCDPAVRDATLEKLAATQTAAKHWLSRHGGVPAVDLDRHVNSREGSPRLAALLGAFLAEQGVLELDRALADRLVSNPASGELVKGHAIVLAELGLAPYRGTIVRDPTLFDESWSKASRAQHLISRLAFMQALWAGWGHERVTVYRAAAVDGQLRARPAPSLVSATFSEEVARAHFAGGSTTQTAVLWRGEVEVNRLLMTFLETAAMNRRFHEAEALLIGDATTWLF
jgi:hypothetical protein